MTKSEIIARLESMATPSQRDLAGMARYGINVENALVISMPKITELASEIKKSCDREIRHKIALELWREKYREAKLLAAIIDPAELVTKQQMEKWVNDFDSWDICDNTIIKLFSYSPLGWEKAMEWSQREEEFVKRAGFVLMACLPIHDKKAGDDRLLPFLDRIKEEATDERNFVKKAVNWALRQIGKSRTIYLYELSLKTAKEILKQAEDDEGVGAKSARWIAKDAIRELESEPIKRRMGIA